MKKYLFVLLFALCAYSANVYNEPGATKVYISHVNNTYATLNSTMGKCQFGITTDLFKPVFKDQNGTMYKMLLDSTGSTNTPRARLFYADTNGRATSSANLTFRANKLTVKGNVQVDTSISTDSIVLKSATQNFGYVISPYKNFPVLEIYPQTVEGADSAGIRIGHDRTTNAMLELWGDQNGNAGTASLRSSDNGYLNLVGGLGARMWGDLTIYNNVKNGKFNTNLGGYFVLGDTSAYIDTTDVQVNGTFAVSKHAILQGKTTALDTMEVQLKPLIASGGATVTNNSYTPLSWLNTSSGITGYLYSDGSGVGITDSLNNYNNLVEVNKLQKAVCFYTKRTRRITIDSLGRVGINKVNQTKTLDVKGQGNFDSLLTVLKLYATDTVSAAVFVDRTPWYSGSALSALKNVKGANGQLDHKSMPPEAFAKQKVKKVKRVVVGKDTSYVEEEQVVEGRDLSMTVSMLIKAVQELSARVDSLEKR